MCEMKIKYTIFLDLFIQVEAFYRLDDSARAGKKELFVEVPAQ